MTFKEWLFETGEFVNPPISGQWGLLHILTLVLCALAVTGAFFLVKHSSNKEKTARAIVLTLACLLLFFEIAQRFVYFFRRFYFNVEDMRGLTALWILLPKPWCAVGCWTAVAAVFVNRKFFYAFASIQGLICTLIYFVYPGTGYNNQYIMFSNLYSITTHALLLTLSLMFIVLKLAAFEYKDFLKTAVCFAFVYAYAFLEIYVLETFADPMYFMPGGDIQANILNIPWGIYIVLYVVLLIVFINAFYLIADRNTVRQAFHKNDKSSKNKLKEN